jgi:hypothetical protein
MMISERIFNMQWLATFSSEALPEEAEKEFFLNMFDEPLEDVVETTDIETDDVVEPDEPAEKEPVVELADDEQPVDSVVPVVAAIPEPVKPVVEPVVPVQEDKPFDIEGYKGELQKLYALSEDDADAVLTDPGTVLPKLMANAHLTMMQQIGHMVQMQLQTLPELINRTVQTKSVEDVRVGAFSKAYPDLVGAESLPFVTTAIKAIRTANPNIDFESLLTRIGPVVSQLMGKEIKVASAQPVVKAAVAKPTPFVARRSTSVPAPAKELTAEEMFYSNLLGD